MKQILHWFTRNRRVLDIDTFDHVKISMLFPLWITLFLAVIAVLAAVYMYRKEKRLAPRRRRLLTTLRAAAYIAMLFVLAQPRLVIEGEGRPKGPLPVVVDRTESMSIEDAGDGLARLDAALALERALTRNQKAGMGLDQSHYLYGEQVLPWNQFNDPLKESREAAEEENEGGDKADVIEVKGTHTSLKKVMTDGLKRHRGVYSPGMIVIGDGNHNLGELVDPAIDYVKKRRIPVYFVPIGEERAEDVSLDYIIGEDIVFVNEKFKAFVNMRQFGFAGDKLNVSASFGMHKLDVAAVTPASEGEMTFPLEHEPKKTGIYDLIVSIPAHKDEITTENNVVTKKIRVIKDRIRILMIFGGPSWELRFLKGAFERDRRVEHRVYLQEVDPRIFKYDQKRFIKKVPEKEDDLFRKFDMVMIGGVDVRSLSKDFHKMLHDFVVNEGGSLVVISDGSDTPYALKGTALEKMLPVKVQQPMGTSTFKQEMFQSLATPWRLRISEEGHGSPMVSFDVDKKRNQEVWDKFPEMFEVPPEVEVRPSGITLVEALNPEKNEEDVRPVIVYHNYGKGMVLYMGFDSTWRWRKEHGDRYFRDFWGKVVQFMGLPHLLGESSQSRIYLDRLEANVGDRVVVTATIRNKDYSPIAADSVNATVERKDAEPIALNLPVVAGRPGIFRSSYYPDVEGRIAFKLPVGFAADPADLAVSRVTKEFQNSGVGVPLINRIADETGGSVFFESLMGSTNIVLAKETSTRRAHNRGFGYWVKNLFSSDDRTHEEKQRDVEAETKARGARVMKLRAEIENRNEDIFRNEKFLDEFAKHILKTVSSHRMPVAIAEQETLWDTAGMMMLALIILCAEYVFRKKWYLD